MWYQRLTGLITGALLVLTLSAPAHAAGTQAVQSSDLSRWLSRDVIPQLRQMLAGHPRYAGQRLQLGVGARDGLSEAIASVLNSNLAGREGITLIARERPLQHLSTPVRIDELDCGNRPRFDYLLRVAATPVEGGQDRVQLELLDVTAALEQAYSWQWRGRFSYAERRQVNKPARVISANGSLNAPWNDRDVDAAAASLSREFACALRPQISNRLSLQWPQDAGLPALFADTVNTTRHLLGNYRELALTTDQSGYQAGYVVEIRIEPFRDDTWQLWLTGTPRSNDLAPVQAVTYFKADPGMPQAAPVASATPAPRPEFPDNPGYALEFIDVQMLDATQSDRGRSRADLQVTLRIGNRAKWPIAYSFTLSGGHFDHCVAQPGYYRHDRYGLLEGRLEGGATEVRHLVIKNAKHRPAPLYGVPKCAGFRDLEGFEEFASQGHKVTEYVRWDM